MDKSVFTSTFEPEKKETEASIIPEPQSVEDIILHIGNLMSSVPPTLAKLLDILPKLREPYQEEMAMNTYIFENEQARKLYKTRKEMYTSIIAAFTECIDSIFVDVQFVDKCMLEHQNYAFSHTQEECDEYQKDIDALRTTVLEHIEEDKKNEKVSESEEQSVPDKETD